MSGLNAFKRELKFGSSLKQSSLLKAFSPDIWQVRHIFRQGPLSEIMLWLTIKATFSLVFSFQTDTLLVLYFILILLQKLIVSHLCILLVYASSSILTTASCKVHTEKHSHSLVYPLSRLIWQSLILLSQILYSCAPSGIHFFFTNT